MCGTAVRSGAAMIHTILVVVLFVYWVLAMVFVWALCFAAARADRELERVSRERRRVRD